MKPTQLLDALRNIRKEIVSFISIVMIGLLAALAYLGIAYTAAALKQDAVQFFNARGLWDAEVTSTMLMTDGDLEEIRALPGIRGAKPVWQVDTRLHIGDGNSSVSIMSLPENISLPVLLEGRLPETANECAVEKSLADEGSFSGGQSIRLDCDKIMDVDPLQETDFVITGIFHTPDHISYMVSVTPYVLVTKESFNREGFDGAFMKTRIRVEETPEDRYSDKYWEAVNPVLGALEALGTERAPVRVEELRYSFGESIREGEAKIEEAREELRQAQQKLEDGRRELEEAEARLEPVPDMLDAGAATLKKGEETLLTVLNTLENWGIQISDSGSLLGKLESVQNMLNNASLFFEQVLSGADLPQEALDIYYEYAALFEHMTVEEALEKIEELSDGSLNLSRIRGKLQTFLDGIEAYRRGREDYYYSGEQYLDALTQISSGRKKLEEGEREYAAGEEKIRNAEKELNDAKAQLDQIGDCRWIVLSNNGNTGYVYAAANSDKLSSLSMSFSSIFLIVGALVIYATISRMVEQQRKLVGVNKALGVFNREIFAKYLVFACGAVLLGVGLGILLAWQPMQRAVLRAYEAHLNYGEGALCFLPFETGLVAGSAVAISLIAVLLGCSQLLRQTALSLMQGAGSGFSRVKKSRSSAKKSLYYRLILRNIMTDLNRVLVTIVSIAGGCVLMVVGFSLKYGISGVPDRQFGGIQTYDAEVFFDAAKNADAGTELERILTENGLPHILLRKSDSIFEADGSLSSLTMIIAEKDSMEGYFVLQDVGTGEALELTDSSALVPRRFWEYYGIDVGEDVSVYDSEMNLRALKVAGVFENYYGQLFFLTPQGYEEIFGSAPEPNCFFVRTEGLSLGELQKKLEGIEGLLRVSDAAADRSMIEQFTSSLNFVVYLMLFIAGMMACFIVANFTMTFIQRKTTELTIMRINGFTSGECIRYVAADLVVTTVLGTVAGLLVGGVMGSKILGVTETPYIQMIREPRLESFLFSALITFGFSVLTNGFALRRIRRLKLTDIN